MSERVCRYCWRRESEIREIIRARRGRVPAVIFDRHDDRCPCLLCKVDTSKKHKHAQEAPAPQPAIVRRSITRRHSTDNRE